MRPSQDWVEPKRQTVADDVFQQLMSQIISLEIVPGTKLSEAEVAKTFGISRQPVREALLRLSDLDLVLIRPQKATLVKKISLQMISHTRFVRAALEVEVVRVASEVADNQAIENLWESLEAQSLARIDQDPLRLQKLDYEFHRLICEAANRPLAFAVIGEYKAHTDRVCTLELADDSGMAETIAGHTRIVEAIGKHDPETAAQMARLHLAHLDDTIGQAERKFPDFFES